MVVLSVVLAVIFTTRFGEDPNLVPSPLLGQACAGVGAAFAGWQRDLRPVHLEGKVVVVNFFASWCVPCREEQPDLAAAADAFADREVVIVEIAYQDDPATALEFLDEFGRSESAIYLADPGSRAAIAYGVFGIPETFFVAADGTVVGKAIGATEALTLGTTIDAVLRGERPGQDVLGDTFTGPRGNPKPPFWPNPHPGTVFRQTGLRPSRSPPESPRRKGSVRWRRRRCREESGRRSPPGIGR